MGRSHAKNNTTQSIFSYHERHRLDYGQKKQRIGADSMKRIDSCCLCLQRAQGAVACQKGHLYCKECILSSLVSQKSMIKAHQASLSAHAEAEAAQVQQARADARARVLRDFERGLTVAIGAGGRTATNGKASSDGVKDQHDEAERGTKRKFELDESAVERLAREAEDQAMRVIEAEQAEARRAKLPAFWLPTLTPEAEVGPLKDIKLQTLCQVGEHPHPTSMKQLLSTTFTYASSAKSSTPSSTPQTASSTAIANDAAPICPSCSREMNNSGRAVLLISRTPAATDGEEPVAKKSKKDRKRQGQGQGVCEAIVRPDKDMIDLQKEGTGYAAKGGAEVIKQGIAFRI